MTLYEIVGILKQIALTQPNVKSATDGSIYDVMNATNSVKYDVVHLSQTKHITDEETDTYGFNIFYVSRLEDSLEDNRLQIQSIGKEVLDNILRTFCENWNIDYPEIIFYPFTQKFADLCAGCYCKVEIEVPKAIICADNFIEEITPSKGIKLENVVVEVDQNGTRIVTPSPGFDGIGKVTIVTDVTGGSCNLEYKEVEYTENGEYTVLPSSGYDGLSEVSVSISVPQGQGYEEGYEDGVADQKAKLIASSFTENGTVVRANGWSAVTVNVPQGQGYEEGYEDGVADQKAKLSTSSVTENGTYTREDGYSAITVNVDDRYDEGYAAGIAYQKSLLASTSFTGNGVYTRENGWNEVTVDVNTGAHRVVFDFSESEDLSGLTGNAVITITSVYGSTAYTYTGENITVLLLPGVNYEFSFSNVSGYSEPANIEFTTVWGGNTTIYVAYDKEIEKDYLTLSINSSGTVIFHIVTAATDDKSYDYRINNASWVKNIHTSTAITVSEGDIIKFRGNNLSYENGIDNTTFYGTNCIFEVYGNIMSLYDKNDFDDITTIPYGHSFNGLFSNCTGLTSAENLELPATTLSQMCYRHMFDNCISLTGAPVLPATTLTEYCYSHMFSNCSSLTTAPDLPAAVLPIYSYYAMFNGCSSLSQIKCLATDIRAENCTYNWLTNVASSGTFVKDPNMTWPTGDSGIPSNWTITDNS